jgi:hypothetical protein
MLSEEVVFLERIIIKEADHPFAGGHFTHSLLFFYSGFAATLKDLFPPFDQFLGFTF